MYEYYPILIVGALIGAFSLVFLIAYLSIKDKKEAIGFDRNMKDGEIIKRLFEYAKPYYKQFIVILVLMIFAISYEILAPLIVGEIEEIIKNNFSMEQILKMVIVYAILLLVSIICTYYQAIVLQKTGQKISANGLLKLSASLF